jgi:hypothetical protein
MLADMNIFSIYHRTVKRCKRFFSLFLIDIGPQRFDFDLSALGEARSAPRTISPTTVFDAGSPVTNVIVPG